jgi:hypothetical protein
VLIELGPYRSSAARAWLTNARQLIEFAAAHRGQLPFSLPLEVIEELQWYLQEWETAASKTDEFRWSGEVDAAAMRKLLTYWLNLARVANERDELPVSSEPGSEFYPSVVGTIIDTLHDEGGHEGFCGRMRTAWPGLGDADCRKS